MINDMGIQVMEEAPDADDLLLAENTTSTDEDAKKLLHKFCPVLSLKSVVRLTRYACICVKWALLNC